jgi:cytochrome c biogenesis protein CcdA
VTTSAPTAACFARDTEPAITHKYVDADVVRLARLRTRLRGQSVISVLALGVVSDLAGFCAGPILGAVLTVAAASGQPARGAARWRSTPAG